ncbi:hypothetical protein CONLIGDRAFT_32352 [Coniochaeta ligniaria NRRL 30616]|uniref:Uncharacterized protein n=1 Tax=Coniochaeta ligniaria NRRL 30616 TaxID=1408157 RepID=A0A1J7K438_9PEZI|nr:hypothetical protein CONLIGDRAFT_32352 [Coniochaeta ligniaria NRRL 30616]
MRSFKSVISRDWGSWRGGPCSTAKFNLALSFRNSVLDGFISGARLGQPWILVARLVVWSDRFKPEVGRAARNSSPGPLLQVIKGRHRAEGTLLDPMRPMAGAMRQLVPRSGPVSLSTSSPMRQTASSLLLRRLQSTASLSSSCSKTAFRRQAFSRPNTSSSLRRSYSSNNPPPPPPKTGATNRVKFWPFFLVVALSSGAYIALVNQRVGELAF